MGGDSFEGVQKLTNQQYLALTKEILIQVKDLCIKAQPYIPLPQKLVHGDIDILIIPKPNIKAQHLIQRLHIQRFRINNNDTSNTVYKNKQVDFNFVSNDQQFEMAQFYKSYSGFGAHLGLFLPSKQVKLSDSGLFALAYQQHIKFEFFITNSIKQILQFYGLNYQIYAKGFQTRKQLFQYLRSCRFLNQKKFIEHDNKNNSKLTKFFSQYLREQVKVLKQEQKFVIKNPVKQTLKYFKKQKQFEVEWQKLLESVEKKHKLVKKFNGMHIIEHFKIQTKNVNKLKQKFRDSFSSSQQYEKFIDENELIQILKLFAERLSINLPPNEVQSQEGSKQKQLNQLNPQKLE